MRTEILKLNQEDFGNNIGMSRSNVANIEVGRIKLTDRNIRDICDKYNVNEDWIRTGAGEPLIEILPEDEYTAAAAEISKNKDEFAMQAIIDYWKLDNDSKQLLKDYIFGIVDKVQKKE